MSTNTPLPPAGWYSDPRGGGGQRWWNGVEWSTETRPAPAAPAGYPGAVAPQPGYPVQPTAPTYAAAPQPGYPAPQPGYPASQPGYPAQPGYPGQPGYAAQQPGYPYALPPTGAWRSAIDNRPVVTGLGSAVRTVFSRYAQFDGRASRSEYWWWVLLNALVIVVVYVLGLTLVIAGASRNSAAGGGLAVLGSMMFLLIWLWELATLVPNLALTIRRLRDGGFHWALIFLALIPLGAIALFVMACLPSKYP